MRIWNDSSGGVFTAELALVTSLVITGAAAGLTNYSHAIQSELADVAANIQSFNQSYRFFGVRSPTTDTVGSQYIDSADVEVNRTLVCIDLSGFEN